MRRVNGPLLVGALIVLLLLIIMLIPEHVTSVNPYAVETMRSWVRQGGQLRMQGAPFPPGGDALLGTDEMGRDIFALILYGTRLTMVLSLLVVIGRFLIALPLGLIAGFGNFIMRRLIEQFGLVFSAVPSLLISIIILKMEIFANLSKGASIFAFVIVLTFVGWAKLAIIIMERVQGILSQPFIKGEIAIGKGRLAITLENVLPHLAAELVVLFFMEVAQALAIIMQMGVFGVFVGNLRLIYSSDGGSIVPMNMSFEPEWASMLASSRNFLRSAPWMVIAPAVAFFVSILGFSLLGEGLKRLLQDRDSRFILYVRKGLSLRNARDAVRSGNVVAWQKPVLTLALLVLIIFSWHYGGNLAASGQITHTPLILPKDAVIGTAGAKTAAQALAEGLKKAGFQPLDASGYVRAYSVEPAYLPSEQKLSIWQDGRETVLEPGKDYALLQFASVSGKGKIFDATRMDLYSVQDYHCFDGAFVLADGAYYGEKAALSLTDTIFKHSSAKGVLWIRGEAQEAEALGAGSEPGFVATVTPRSAKLLRAADQVEAVLASKKIEGPGQNVIGILSGTDSKSQEAILIGTGYNYLAKNAVTVEEKVSALVDLAAQLAARPKRNQSVILAFWDGNLADAYDGARAYAQNPPYAQRDTVIYLDLSKMGSLQKSILSLDSVQAPVSRYFAWNFAHRLELGLKSEGLDYRLKPGRSEDAILQSGASAGEAMFIKLGIPTVKLGTSPVSSGEEPGPGADAAGKAETGARTAAFEDLDTLLLKTIGENKY